jgi:hypothetical protein
MSVLSELSLNIVKQRPEAEFLHYVIDMLPSCGKSP